MIRHPDMEDYLNQKILSACVNGQVNKIRLMPKVLLRLTCNLNAGIDNIMLKLRILLPIQTRLSLTAHHPGLPADLKYRLLDC